jgi:hypothetical protein
MPSAESAPVPNRPNFQVRRPDTLQFATVEGLTRMAGVSRGRLRALIAKEAVDNALDAADAAGWPGDVTITRDGDRYVVEDQGSGISGDAATLADLFSTSRPMLTAKFMRRPERGALGNGIARNGPPVGKDGRAEKSSAATTTPQQGENDDGRACKRTTAGRKARQEGIGPENLKQWADPPGSRQSTGI